MQRRNAIGPISIGRPILGQPGQGAFGPSNLNVSTGDQCRELLTVAEKTPTDGRFRERKFRPVGLREGEEMIDGAHATHTIGKTTALVNGNLTGLYGSPMRSDYRPMLSSVLERVEARLTALGLSANAASKEAGLSADAIRNLRRAAADPQGRQGVSTKTIMALAPVLRTSVEWLLTGEGEHGDGDSTDSVAVVGFVGAGSVATLFSEGQGPFDEVEAPAHATPNTVGLAVRGASLGPAFDEGIVFYDDVRSPVTPDLHGRLCVVGLEDGRVLVKILRSAGDGTFHLFSNTLEEPLLNEPVAWAARVKDVRPR